MKNKIFILLLVFFFKPLLADTLNIKSATISIDKKTKLTQFKNNVVAKDEENNILKTEYAEYNKEKNILVTKDQTTITTSENFFLSGKNIVINNIEGQEFIDKYGFSCPIGVKGRNSHNKLYKDNIGWESTYPLRDGMKKTFEWINKQVNVKKKQL